MRGAVAAILLAIFWRRYAELRAPFPRAREAALALAAGVAVFFAWITLDSGWFVFSELRDGFDPTRAGRIDWALASARLAVLTAIVPVMEELFWRSFLMRWIDARDFLARPAREASRMALAISSGLFALEHSLWLAGIIAGLAYGWLYKRTNNLWAPIVAHTVTNAILGGWILATGNWRHW